MKVSPTRNRANSGGNTKADVHMQNLLDRKKGSNVSFFAPVRVSPGPKRPWGCKISLFQQKSQPEDWGACIHI